MTTNSLILSVETATLAGSICLSRGPKVIASSEGDPNTSHSNTLLAEVDALLSQTDLNIQDVDVFAVASGPGSFTGLRIGIATIKALAATLNRACIGIPTLQAIAHTAHTASRIVTLLPAGRGEVFCQMFSSKEADEPEPLNEAAHLSPAKMIERYRHFDDIVWTGEGAMLYAQLINESVSSRGARIIEPPSNLAQHIGALAFRRLSINGPFTPNDLHALYVRPSDAELKS